MSGVQKGKRVEKSSNERRGVLILLIAASVVAVVCAVLPSVWAVRAGVVVALAAAWVSVIMAWREVEAVRTAHFAEMRRMRRDAADAERRHHEESMDMIDTFAQRVGAISKTLTQTRAKLDRAENELSTLRGDKAALQYKVSAGNKKVNELEARIAELETELQSVLSEAREGRLVSLTRTGSETVPSAEEIWAKGNDTTIVDLSRVAFPVIDAAPERRKA